MAERPHSRSASIVVRTGPCSITRTGASSAADTPANAAALAGDISVNSPTSSRKARVFIPHGSAVSFNRSGRKAGPAR